MNVCRLFRLIVLGVVPKVLVVINLLLMPLPVAAVVDFYDVAFVEIAGRPGHEGYFPIQGSPIQGASAVVRVRLFGPVGTAQIKFISSSGATLAVVPVSRSAGNDPTSPVFYGPVQIPYQVFRVVVGGTDQSGAAFLFDPPNPVLIEPTSLDVKILATTGVVVPNTPTVVYANLTNHGATDTFSISVTDNIGNLAVPAVHSIAVASQTSAAVKISVTVPQSPEPLARYRLSVAARGTNRGASNSAAIELPFGLRAGQSVVVDVMPGSCRNTIQPKSRGVTPVAILGGGGFDPSTVDPKSIRIAGIVSPLRISIEDVGSPWNRDCDRIVGDYVPDLLLHFDTQDLVDAIRTQNPEVAFQGRAIAVRVYARARNGTEYIGYDEVFLLK